MKIIKFIKNKTPIKSIKELKKSARNKKIKNINQKNNFYNKNDNINNLNLRTKGKKKNSNIGSSTELSTLIRKKIKEFSRSIVIPTLKEPNNIIKTTNNTNNTIKITDISLKKENGSEIKK